MITIKGYKPLKLFERTKDATATVVRRAMSSKMGCATCQKARRLVGRSVLKAIGKA